MSRRGFGVDCGRTRGFWIDWINSEGMGADWVKAELGVGVVNNGGFGFDCVG